MESKGRSVVAPIGLFLASASLIVASTPTAHAATVSATGTDAAICNQEVSDNTNVTAVRLVGGDCVITFSAGTATWTAPKNLRSAKILLVAGGGGGGGSYDTTGAGGGGAGQVLLVNARKVTPTSQYEIKVGAGGAAGFHVGQTNSVDAIGKSGENTYFALDGVNLHVAYAGGGGGSSRANGPGTSSRVGGSAATLSSGGVGGGPGGGGFSGGGGGGSAGAGANGNTTDPARDTASPGGAGTAVDISGASITYGVGGAGGYQDNTNSVAGASAGANTGSGGGGASVGGSTYRNGGAGGSGVVIIRYSTTLPVFSDISISGNPTVATFRAANTISATVNVASLITFYAGKNRIAGCISIPTTGSGSNNVATCTWKPTTKGAVVISAEAAPTAAGLAGTSTTSARISVVNRTTRR